MFCPKCGRPIKDGEICECQKNQNAADVNSQFQAQSQAPVQPPVQTPSQPVYTQYSQNTQNYYTPQAPQQPLTPPYGTGTAPATPAIAALRRHGGSGLMLAAVICFGSSLLFNIIVSITGYSVYGSLISDLFPYMDMEYEEMNTMISVASAVGFVRYLPTILIAIGFLLFYIACKKPTNGLVKTTGLTMIKVVFIINAIFTIFGVFFVALMLALIGLGGMNNSVFGYSDWGGTVMISAIVIGVLVIAFMILILVLTLRTISALETTGRTGVPNIKISMFLIVVLILSAASGIMGSFSSMNSTISSGLTFNIIIMIASVSSGAGSLLVAISLIKYRNEITAIALNSGIQYNAPQVNVPYTQAPQVNTPYTQAPPTAQTGGTGVSTVCSSCGTVYDRQLDKCPNCGAFNMNKPQL